MTGAEGWVSGVVFATIVVAVVAVSYGLLYFFFRKQGGPEGDGS